MARDMRRDLAVCFTWKHIRLGFPSLPQNWQRHDGGWCTWHHHGCYVDVKLKTDGLMRWAASDSATHVLPFLCIMP
jgi:hypothetical protein